MKLHCLNIPESSNDLAKWIESQVIDRDFFEFVGQLEVVRESGPNSDPMELSDIVGDTDSASLQGGLNALSTKQLRQLLANPNSLVELHHLVFANGYQNWIGNSRVDANLEDRLVQIKRAILQAPNRDSKFVPNQDSENQLIDSPIARRRSMSLMMLAAAAIVLIFFGVGWKILSHDRSTHSNWGWLADGALRETASPNQYMMKLADGGDAWFDVKPQNSEQYVQRLTQLLEGCNKLIGADHAALAQPDQEWLLQRCRSWQKKFETQLSEFDGPGNSSLDEFLARTNQTVTAMVKALQEKANSI